uniref:EF-hand domain-containing protein n=1 Tax=Alexandrium monilatum TaxID=311494 RepID=A0A7S4V8T3_9DINO
MNADLGAFEQVFCAVPSTKWMMMAFIIVTNWAIFSILTAVVSDNMAMLTEAHERDLNEREAAERDERRAITMELMFKRFDKDGDGEIGLKEIRNMLSDPAEMAVICDMTGLEKDELHDTLELVAGEGKGKITHEGFRQLIQDGWNKVTGHSFLKNEARLNDILKVLARGTNRRMKRQNSV